MSPTLEQVAEIVATQLGLERVEESHRLREELAATSADVLNIVVALEDRFGIAIAEEDLAELDTVADLSRLVSRRT